MTGDCRLETEDWRLKTGDWGLTTETGDWRLETGDWRLETGDWRLEAGGWRVTRSVSVNYCVMKVLFPTSSVLLAGRLKDSFRMKAYVSAIVPYN